MASFGVSFTPTYHHDTYPAIDNLSAEGKVVLITGGSKGVGKGTAAAFAKARARAVFITGRGLEALQETQTELSSLYSSTQIRIIHADVLEFDKMNQGFHDAVQEFGAVDVLVSNACYSGHRGPVTEEDEEEAWKAFEVNLRGAFNIVRTFLKVAKKGVIINVSSGAAYGATPNRQKYKASKLAMIAWLSSIRPTYPHIMFYNSQPGVILTHSNKAVDLVEDKVELAGNFHVWLTTEAAEFLNGTFIFSNWDVNELIQRKQDILENHLLQTELGGWKRLRY